MDQTTRERPAMATTTAFPLHLAAMRSEDEELKRLLGEGADVNALDDQGRTLLACAVVGEEEKPKKRHCNKTSSDNAIDTTMEPVPSDPRLNVFRTLFEHPDITLFTLNAPQRAMQGVTPLAFAAYLNEIELVMMMLEDSGNRVAVDGMDAHGATPLMYAARDGSIEVADILLAWGARPDFRDANDRTSIQFALPHPTVLCLLEDALRRRRWCESQSVTRRKIWNLETLLPWAAAFLPSPSTLGLPNPKMLTEDVITESTTILINAILLSNTQLVYQTLFPVSSQNAGRYNTTLVNRPDFNGWSPIHYCVSHQMPSVEVLDALYCAAADLGLFTTFEHYTPLHCLAKCALSCGGDQSDERSPVYQFTMHLVRDLQAPLAARDKHDETCMHLAAEHGENLDVLLAFLECDTTGAVELMRNDRGLTPFEVAKPEFRAAFKKDGKGFRSTFCPSTRSLRISSSFVSLSSVFRRCPGTDSKLLKEQVTPHTPDFNVSARSQQLLANLRLTSPSIAHDDSPEDLRQFGSTLRQTGQIGRHVIEYLRACVQDTVFETHGARIMCGSLTSLSETIKVAVEISCCWHDERKKRDRLSKDSEGTVVASNLSHWDYEKVSGGTKVLDDENVVRENPVEYRDVSVSTDSVEPSGDISVMLVDPSSDSSACGADAGVVKASPQDVLESDLISEYPESTNDHEGQPENVRKEGKFRNLIKKVKDSAKEDKAVVEEHGDTGLLKSHSMRSKSKLKAWLKRKILPDRRIKLEIVWDVDDELECAVGREEKRAGSRRVVEERWDSYEMNETHLNSTFPSVGRDLEAIRQSLDSVNNRIGICQQAIARTERIIRRALEKRESLLESLRLQSDKVAFDDLFVRPMDFLDPASGRKMASRSCSRPRTGDSPSSIRSSSWSMASVVIEGDDEDTRLLRRLFRKIEAQLCGLWDDIERVMIWLQILTETLRGVRREV